MDTKTWIEDPALLDSTASALEKELAPLHTEMKSYARYYWDRPVIAGIDYSRPYRESAVFDAIKTSSTGSLTREVVDAASANICREMSCEVYPMGADHDLEMGCKEASRLIEGVFDNSEFLRLGTRAFRDACTYGFGAVKGFVDPIREEIRFARMHPLRTLWVDNGTDSPRVFVEEYPISTDELIARYPQFKSRIKDLPPWTPPIVVGVDPPGARHARDVTTVKVVEAWCSAIGASSGRHCVVAGDIVLEDEKWVHDITAVVTCKWGDDDSGLVGLPLARVVAPHDSNVRRLTRMVYEGLTAAVPWIVEQADSEVSAIGDVPFQRVKYEGMTPPTVYMPQTVSPEVIAEIERERLRAFAEGGVNQQMAGGAAPSRYTSAVAQREFVDIANTRLADAQKQWQYFWTNAAKVVVMLAAQARKMHVRVKGTNHYESVNFPKLSRDKFRINFGLTSGLSLTPAGRKQDLQDFKDMGLMDLPDVARSLNLPDTRGIADRLNAPRDLVMRQISQALDKGVFVMPSSMQGDQLAALVKEAGEAYQLALLQGNKPPENLEKLRRLRLAALARMAPPPAPMPAPANDNGIPLPVEQPAPPPTEAPPQMAVA